MEENKKEEEKDPNALPIPPWKVKKHEHTLDIKADPNDTASAKSDSKKSSSSTKRLKKIGALSMAKAYGVMGLITGLIFALVYGVVFFVIGRLSSEFPGMESFEGELVPGYGYVAIIAIPAIYAVFGFLGGAMAALGFNVIMKITGGIELKLED